MQRTTPARPLSRMQLIVCDLLGVGLTAREVAKELHISVDMVKQHTKRAAEKLPGDLPAQSRCVVWARGATLDVLQGLTLRYEVTATANGERYPRSRDVLPHHQTA